MIINNPLIFLYLYNRKFLILFNKNDISIFFFNMKISKFINYIPNMCWSYFCITLVKII